MPLFNLVALVAFVAVPISASPAAAETWIVRTDLWGNPAFSTLVICRDRNDVTGDLDGDRINGRSSGDRLSLVDTDQQGRVSIYTLRVRETELTGTADMPDTNDSAARASHVVTGWRVPERSGVVVDVANSPSFEDAAVLVFFEASSRNLLYAEAATGVRHVALSVVGTERMQGSRYFRAKLAQERLIEASPIPYTIVHATHFFEFMGGIAQTRMREDIVRLSPAAMQPMASTDLAEALADAALATPMNGLIDIAGPECAPLAEFVGTWLGETDDPRPVAVDPAAPYFGVEIDDASLTPGPAARIMPTRFDDWLARHLPTRMAA